MKSYYDSKQEKITYCDLGEVFVRLNEEEVEMPEQRQIGLDEYETIMVKKYVYDEMLIKPKYQTEESILDWMRENKIKEITKYDSSDHVNVFYFGGVKMWLDKATRAGLITRFTSAQSVGEETTTLWYGNMSFTMPISTAFSVLYAIENYASKCYDVTASHKKDVESLTTLEDVFNYDRRQGYPQVLKFNL